MAEEAGLAPKTDAELPPVLLDLIGGRVPVSAWPTQMAKKKRTEHAREAAQGQAAAADRPTAPVGGPAPGQANVTPLRWRQRAGQARDGIDADRRRRRKRLSPSSRGPPRPLGGELPGTATCSSSQTRTRKTVDQPSTDDESPLVPFLRAGPPPRPHHLGGLAAMAAVPPLLHPGEAAVGGPSTRRSATRGQALHDLHRTATHVNLRLQETPMSKTVVGPDAGGGCRTTRSSSAPGPATA